MLAFAGYGGVNLLQKPGTPSLLDIQRGFCSVDATGMVHSYLYQVPDPADKMNPRGAATDGTGNCWGAGKSGATLISSIRPAGNLRWSLVP